MPHLIGDGPGAEATGPIHQSLLLIVLKEAAAGSGRGGIISLECVKKIRRALRMGCRGEDHLIPTFVGDPSYLYALLRRVDKVID